MQGKGLGYTGILFAVLLLNFPLKFSSEFSSERTLNLPWHKEARMTLVYY